MKRLARQLLIATLLGVVVLTSLSLSTFDRVDSSIDQNDPVAVASQYIRLMHREEFEKVKEISTPESHALLDLFIAFGSLGDDLLETFDQVGSPDGSADRAESDEIEFTIVRTVMDDDVAYVHYIEHDYGSEEEAVMLKRVDGQWLIHIAKEDVIDEGFADLPVDIDGFDAFGPIDPKFEEFSDGAGGVDYEAAYATFASRAADGFLKSWNSGDYASASDYTSQSVTRFLFERAAGQHAQFPSYLEQENLMFFNIHGPYDFYCIAPGSETVWVLKVALVDADDFKVVSFEPYSESDE